uniref:CDGSH iron-sulfur domain-containing protein 3, mitochondrial n=1 Tax=Aceria tosichella TaxID=561515 RepID=A0A6G1SPS0_9ACAR
MASANSKTATPILKALTNKAIRALDSTNPGHVHCKLPFKYECKAGRAYMWCSCGWSRTQPFCDATHANIKFKIKNRPLRFECKETKEYWFCQCKHTKTRPFCDGSHNTDIVQKAKSTLETTN